jgi:hypothetical protein
MIKEANAVMTTEELAARFNELAQQEKWFEIQEEFFSDDVRSIEPKGSPYMKDEQGKNAVRKKGEAFVSKVREVHRMATTAPIVSANHFVVGRHMDFTVEGFGRIQIDELMLYEVRDGKIVLEQFFY